MSDQTNNNQVQQTKNLQGTIRRSNNLADGYVIIARSIAQATDLSFELKGFLLYLLSLPMDWHVSVKHIQRNFSVGREKVRKWLRSLESLGYATLEEGDSCHEEIPTNNLRRTFWVIHGTPVLKKCFPRPKNKAPEDTVARSATPNKVNKEEKEKEEKNKRYAPSSRSSPKFEEINFSLEYGEFKNISPTDMEAWKKAYPGVDLDGEIKCSFEWIKARPTKQNRTLWRKFLTTWFQTALRNLKSDTGKAGEKTAVSPDEQKEIERVYKKYTAWMDVLTDPMILNSGRLLLAAKTIVHTPSNMNSKKTLEGFRGALQRYCKLNEEQIKRILN